MPPGGFFIFKGKTANEVHAERDRAEKEDRGINEIVEDMHQHPRDLGVKKDCIALANLAMEPVEASSLSSPNTYLIRISLESSKKAKMLCISR